ncbi:hypothetical protein [Microseira wollei]|uniref:hypothetical protein n=1 Tax=Microseira wollei TaxID=467598 RepID=UPI001CFD7253|nr:hypothetical protein [Microseira wollei]
MYLQIPIKLNKSTISIPDTPKKHRVIVGAGLDINLVHHTDKIKTKPAFPHPD